MSFPVIPREEYPLRWQAVREFMREKGLDLIFAYADDHFTYGNAYSRYYADFPTAFEPVLIMFLQDRDPILLTGPETDGYAAEVGTIRDIRALYEFAHEDEDYPFSRMEYLRDVIANELGRAPGRVGITCPGLVGSNIYAAIEKACGGVALEDVDEALSNMRGIKSEAELKVIRYAYELARYGMQAAIDAIAPGVTEREMAAAAEFAMRSRGSDGTGIDMIIASGPNNRHILARATNRRIEENDVVIVTVAPRYEGYHGAIGRTVFVGQPSEEYIALMKAQEKAQQVCASQFKPGNVGSEAEGMARAVMAEAGYDKNFLYSGIHSVGVIEFEPPILGPSSDTRFAENMVVSIDIPTFESPIGGARTEDGYIITADGCEHLTSDIPRIIIK